MGTVYVTPFRKSKKVQQDLIGVKTGPTQSITSSAGASAKHASALPAGTEYVQVLASVDGFVEVGVFSSVTAVKPDAIPVKAGIPSHIAVDVDSAGVAAIDLA